MKKAIKISAVLVALVVLAAMAFVFTSSAAEVTSNTVDDLVQNLAKTEDTTVKLGANIGDATDTTVYNVAGKITLDLCGKTITSAATGNLFVQTGVTNPVEFVIKDSVGGGAIIAPEATLISNFGGTVKIEGGTIVVKNLVDTADGKKVPTITVAQAEDAANGTWTSFDPTNYLVLGFATTNETSTVDARATYSVAPAKYTITYVVPTGATNPNTTVEYTIWDEVTFADASAFGYEFDGWYLKTNSGETKITQIDKYAGKQLYDIELVGKFTATTHKITYVGVTDEEHTNGKTFTVEYPNIKLTDAKRAGYEFLGWYTEANGAGTRVTEITCSTLDADQTVYAHFAPISYTITYVTYGFAPVSGATLVGTYTIEDAVTFPEMTKEGYQFLNWSTKVEATEDTIITGIEAGTTGNVTVYVNYKTIDYKITFGESDKIVTPFEDITFTVETPTIFLDNPEVKPGYTFAGWKDANGTIISAIPVGTVGDIALTPVINETSYKIFYVFGPTVLESDVNNDKNATDWYKFTISDTPALVAPSRAHYDFLGWAYEDPTGATDIDAFLEENGLDYDATNKVWTIPAGTTKNVTVYAVWAEHEYSITYDANGFKYQILVDAEGRAVLDANGDVQYVANDGTTVVTDKTLMVKETDFGESVAELAEGAPQSYTYFEDVTIPVPTRDGYTFVRWYDENTGTYLEPVDGVVSFDAQTRNGDLALKAEWEIAKYTATIKYQFNADYYGANLEALKADTTLTDDGRTFLVAATFDVVYGTPVIFDVDLYARNGFIPETWEINEIMGVGDTEYVVYFEPVIRSTEFKDGKLVITYHDDTTKTVDVNSVSGVKYESGKLVYVDANGQSTTVAYATSADLAKAVEDLNKLITDLTNGQVKTNTEEIAALKAELVKIATNANDIASLKTSVTDLQAQIDALAGKNTTYLVLIIIVAIISVAAAAGVVVLFVKK